MSQTASRRLFFSGKLAPSGGGAVLSPSLDEVGEGLRLHVVGHGIVRNGDPRQRTPRPDMSDRKEPARVIKISRLHDSDFGVGLGLVKKSGAAIGA